MKSKKVIKFLIIGHNEFEKWVPFFIEGFKNNLDDLIFLFDNEIDDNLRKKLQNKNIKYFENEENIGKLNTLIKWSNEFNSDYVKIIDSDDSVIFNKIDIFIKAIENFVSYNNESHLLVHRGTVLKSNNYHYGLQSDDIYTISKQIYESTDLFWNLPPNAKNIYPTEVIKKLKGIDIVRQNYFNDDFLSLFTLLFTKNNVGYINEDIYIQFQANGQTSKITFERLENFRIQYENLGRCVNKLKFMPEVPGKINLDKTIKMNQMWIDRYKENNHLSAEEETKLNNQFIEAVNTFFNLIKKRNALIIKNDLAEDTIIFIAKILKVINENSSYLVFDSELQSDKMKLLKEISLKMLNANFLLKKGKEYFYFSGEKFNDDFLKINYLDSDKIEVDEHCGSYVESILRNLKIELPQTLNKYICWDISSFSDLIIAQKSIWSFYEFNKNKEFIIFINYEIKLREKIIEFTNKLQKLRIKVVVRFIRNNYFLNSLEDIYKKNFYWLFNNFGFGKNDIMLRVENSVIFTDNILNNLFQKRNYDINTIYTVCNEGANSKIDGSIYLFSPFHIYYLVKSVLLDKDIDEVFSNEVKFPYSFLNELNIEDLSYISKYRIGQKDEDIKAPLFINYMKHKSYSYKGILSLLKINNEIFKNDLKKYIQGDKPKWTTLMQEAFDITNKLLSEQECERLDILEDINLTFIVTFYKTLNSDIEYWKNTYELFKAMNLDMHILVDDIDINDKFGWVASEDLFINTQNKGKLLSVYEHIKKGNVRTKHFKTIDPDDRISIVEIIKSKWLFDDDQIITMPSFRISGELPINQYEVENMVIKCDKIWFENFGTSWTILPTKLIKNDKYFDGTRIDINEDQILGQIAYSNGGRIKHLNRNWYIYKKEGGISNIDNFPSYIYIILKKL